MKRKKIRKHNKNLIIAIISLVIIGVAVDLLFADGIDWYWMAGGITGV